MRTTLRQHSIRTVAVAAVAALGLVGCGGGGDEPSVEFVSPEDGAVVESPVTVEMAVEGVTVEPASEGVNEGRGHLHVMVDTPCLPAGETIPADESHVHFGDASTTAELDLEVGEHTLCLQFASGDHVATALTDEITITVE